MSESSEITNNGQKLTNLQRQRDRKLRQARQEAMFVEVESFLAQIEDKVQELSTKYKKPQDYFERLFYQPKSVTQKRNINICNAARQVEAALNGRKGGMCFSSHLFFISYNMISFI